MQKTLKIIMLFVLICLLALPSTSYANRIDSNKVEKTRLQINKEIKSEEKIESISGGESNGALLSSKTRQNIDLNKQYAIPIKRYVFDDYNFEFTVPSNGYIEIKLGKIFVSDNEIRHWETLLSDINGETYIDDKTEYNLITDDKYIYYKIGLKPGTYYFDLTPRFWLLEDSEFPLLINFTATEYFEKENNSTMQLANQIELGKTYSAIGGGDSGDSIDFFKFTTTTTGDVKMKVKCDPESKFNDYNLYSSLEKNSCHY